LSCFIYPPKENSQTGDTGDPKKYGANQRDQRQRDKNSEAKRNNG
jgi:hypothetical protein